MFLNVKEVPGTNSVAIFDNEEPVIFFVPATWAVAEAKAHHKLATETLRIVKLFGLNIRTFLKTNHKTVFVTEKI